LSAASPDVVVVGAGIVGAACAFECARAGLSVSLLESGIAGGGATAAGMGHIVVMDDSEAQFELTLRSRRLWDDLAMELPPRAEFVRTGTIWVASDDDEMNGLRKRQKFYRERGVETELLDAPELAEAEPELRTGLAGGLLVPGDAVVYPPCVTEFLIDRLRACGGNFRPGTEVVAVESGSVMLKDGSRLQTGYVVVAAGQWAKRLLPPLPLRWRKGHLVITDRYPGFVRHQLVETGYLKSAHSGEADSVAFNIQPRATGQMLLGSSRQFDVDDAAVDALVVGHMVAKAADFLPGLGRLQAIRAWTGQRAATPDKLPLVGPVTGKDGVIAAAGHEGLGITTSLGTAHLVRALVTNQRPDWPIEPYLPSRFAEVQDARRD
jgi:glycine/D-amino acid oxidase-like deaminating enzyme